MTFKLVETKITRPKGREEEEEEEKEEGAGGERRRRKILPVLCRHKLLSQRSREKERGKKV